MKLNDKIFLWFIVAALLVFSFGQSVAQSADPNEIIFKQKMKFAVSLKLQEKPMGEVMTQIGKSFLGTKYTAHTIEASGEEHLIVDLQTVDCVTFYENTLVLARCIKQGLTTFGDFKKELQFVRYRSGVIDGYPSRLHYTSDYFYDNEKKGVLKDITHEIGGVPYRKTIDFMSTHADVYPKLKEFPDDVKKMRAFEDSINYRKLYHIPKANIKAIASKIHDGDIIAITTTNNGLDCKHTGIAVWVDGTLRLMHAPLPGSQVQITSYPLWEYLSRVKDDAGIMVARPMEIAPH
ncbi:MAG TPA: N-acetylmuramoyl-L-alanine amidase-like domain-containing protein [Bacteroidota bacterium]|nr:N-acetylmuramoyl-L-alanine amidase-like domain-containing protein [Bacteroidota bacterium]